MNKIIALVFLLSVLIWSCSKKADDVGPEPDKESSKITLQSDIIGKWMIEVPNARKAEKGAFIEFLSDSTYIIYNLTPSIVTGKYKATSNTEITLDKFGTASEVKIAQGKVSFKIVYSGTTVLLSAIKSSPVDASDKTRLLAHYWSLNNEGDAALIFEGTDDLYGKQIEKLTIRFSPSGTYMIELFNKGAVFRSEMSNWKWHSTKADRFVFWSGNEKVDEEKNFILIKELTDKVLKTTEYVEFDAGKPEPFNLVFTRID